MLAALLKDKITFLKEGQQKNKFEDWFTVAASVNYLGGARDNENNQINYVQTLDFRVYFNPDITENLRIRFKNKIYLIEFIRPADSLTTDLLIKARKAEKL